MLNTAAEALGLMAVWWSTAEGAGGTTTIAAAPTSIRAVGIAAEAITGAEAVVGIPAAAAAAAAVTPAGVAAGVTLVVANRITSDFDAGHSGRQLIAA
jgi:hypothetical protein